MNRVYIHPNQPPELSLAVKAAPREGLFAWRSAYENGHQEQSPAIFMTQATYERIQQHAARIDYLEVGGMLVGQVYHSPAKHFYVVIEAILEAQHIDHSPVHLTFTAETLTDMHNRLEEGYPDKQIVGWYHTHPGLSIFLSSMDVWLHTHFFPQPWHVALVVDPRANHGGFFSYQQDNPGYIDSRAYRGFYEIGNLFPDSIVSWSNLERDEIEFSGTLWDENQSGKEE